MFSTFYHKKAFVLKIPLRPPLPKGENKDDGHIFMRFLPSHLCDKPTILPLEEGKGYPLSIDQGFARGDQIVSVVKQFDIIDSRPLGPADFSRLGNEPAFGGRRGNIGNIHVQSHYYCSVGVGGGFKGFVNQGK